MKILIIIMTSVSILAQEGGEGGGTVIVNDNNQSCTQQCQGQPNVSTCESQCSQSNLIVAIICGCVLLLLFICICCQVVQLQKLIKGLKKNFLESVGFNKDNDQSENSMSEINNRRWECTFWQESTAHRVKNFQLCANKNTKTGEFEIKVSGEDDLGKWKGNGVVACDGSRQIHIWFLKVYQNGRQAKQTGKWNILIYQGSKYPEQQTFNGRWWFHGFSQDPKYSGAWIMQTPLIQKINYS